MNIVLMENIIRHVFANLAVIPSEFINFNKTKSLMSKEFLLHDTLSFDTDNGTLKNKIWGCQISADEQEFKMLLGDCSLEKNTPEYCLVTQLKNAPAYGVYLSCDTENSEPLIACTLNGKEWMECQTYLQATFLAGMEQLKDIGLSWNKCSSYKEQYDLMTSFINFHNSVYEYKDEG